MTSSPNWSDTNVVHFRGASAPCAPFKEGPKCRDTNPVSFLLQLLMIVALMAILQDCACDDRRERRDLGNGACPHDLEFEERLDMQAHAARNQTCGLRRQRIGYRAS